MSKSKSPVLVKERGQENKARDEEINSIVHFHVDSIPLDLTLTV